MLEYWSTFSFLTWLCICKCGCLMRWSIMMMGKNWRWYTYLIQFFFLLKHAWKTWINWFLNLQHLQSKFGWLSVQHCYRNLWLIWSDLGNVKVKFSGINRLKVNYISDELDQHLSKNMVMRTSTITTEKPNSMSVNFLIGLN